MDNHLVTPLLEGARGGHAKSVDLLIKRKGIGASGLKIDLRADTHNISICGVDSLIASWLNSLIV